MTEVALISTKPGRYAVRLGDELIVEGSRDPEHDAARALLARGITGPMVTMRSNGVVCMNFASIEATAKLTMKEGPSGPKVKHWMAPPSGPIGSPARLNPREAEMMPPDV